MTVMEWDTTQPQTSATSFEVLPTDIYVMTIAEAAMEDDKFAEVDREGNVPQKLVLKWETSKLTAEQQEAGIGMGEPVWQRFNPYYGTVKAGGPSKFKAFVDSLIEQKLLPARFTPADFVGIVQRCKRRRVHQDDGRECRQAWQSHHGGRSAPASTAGAAPDGAAGEQRSRRCRPTIPMPITCRSDVTRAGAPCARASLW
jgi:hypothetical protein